MSAFIIPSNGSSQITSRHSRRFGSALQQPGPDDPQSATGIADSVVEFRYELEDINSPLSATWIWVTYNYDAQNQRLLSVRERLELRPAGN